MKEILKDLVQKIDLPQDHYLDQDAEILGIFVEELDEIFEILEPRLKQWLQDADDQNQMLKDIRRYFHTLKGSGRMVGANSSSELAWTVEDTLNRVITGSLQITSPLQQYVQLVFNIYKYKLYPEFKSTLIHHLDIRPLILLGHQIQQKQSLEPALEELLVLSNSLNGLNMLTGLELHTQDENINQVVNVQDEPLNNVLALETDSLLTETLTIFVEESEEHLATIEDFLQQDQHNSEQYNRLIRALHTMRGSSSMAHVEDVFEASGRIEHLFKMLVQEDTESSINENTLLIHYAEFVKDYLHVLKSKNANKYSLDDIYQQFNDALERYDFQSEYSQELEQATDLVSQLINLNIDLLLDAEFEFDKRARNEFPFYFEQLSQQAQSLIENTQNRAAQGIHDFSIVLKESYDTILQKPVLLNTDYVFELFSEIHQEFIHLFDTLASGQRVGLKESTQKTLEDLTTYLQQDVELLKLSVKDESIQVNIENEVAIDSGIGQVLFAINQDKQAIYAEGSFKEFDAEVLEIFIEEADELLVGIDHDLNIWSDDLLSTTALNNLLRYLHTLKGGANMVQASNIGLIAHELETVYERVIKNQIQVNPKLVQYIRSIQDDMTDRIQILREQSIDYSALNILAILHRIEKLADSHNIDALEDDQYPLLTDSKAEDALLDEVSEIDQVELIARESYFEEAEELLIDAKKILLQWFDQRSNRSLLLQLQRIAHTLKGGAKMVKIEQVADISYELETAFEKFGLHNFNSNAYDTLLETAFSWLEDAILKQNYQYFESLKNNLINIEYVDVSAQLPNKLTRTDLLLDRRVVEFLQGDGTEPPSMMGEWDQSEKTEQNNEMIRISADLVEKMIDLSGENAINRSRIEMDLGQLGNTLSDMELAIQRLADQLRRMDGELESQILAKHSDFSSRYADFDPLEMDQYSSLNQLSKSLAESASDLVDFKTTLSEKIRDTEGLLLQQSRIQAEIQESLMRTRLVPFSRLLPRLQRLVRQTASTLNRPTELIVNNTEGELDRTILEKLMSPLEHMLRNAIDHGIEESYERQKLNKPATGRIDLNISRQGTDVIVNFTDDGKGIDAELIREKALQQGLIRADADLTKEEILQLIFHPGFSTATQVTQISGRGVGLDVVQSEIKSLGGQVSVASDFGSGSSFTIRVPTTVAVSDALMVKVGDQQFAIPLTEIDRIVRISPTALDEFFESKDEYFEIDHQSYKLRYLGEFVANQAIPRLQGVAHSLPVLLIKGNTGQTIALLIDQLVGSRSQIVVKSIGQQFANIGAITGATILGDGHVCLILDGQNIARQIQSTQRIKENIEQRDYLRRTNHRRLVMIVDDSVTVRKVTSRLLERNGFDVITAKDGIDAIEQLENIQPDLMLLDIEMPRMDGFEVTNLVRHHDLHRDLPIIMITSRTGEKHRERAFSLGVTSYMGKPFQEIELLENIEALLETR